MDNSIVIIDNAMPDRIVDNWKDFYINHARLTYGRTESSENTSAFLTTTFTLEQMYNVFDFESWLLPEVRKVQPQIKTKHLVRSHLNVNTQQDTMHGHVDIMPERFANDSFYISTVLFLNPEINQFGDNGLEIENTHVENKFNRLVIFDGRKWHRAIPPTDNFVRLTGYFSFSNIALRETVKQTINVWYR